MGYLFPARSHELSIEETYYTYQFNIDLTCGNDTLHHTSRIPESIESTSSRPTSAATPRSRVVRGGAVYVVCTDVVAAHAARLWHLRRPATRTAATARAVVGGRVSTHVAVVRVPVCVYVTQRQQYVVYTVEKGVVGLRIWE